MTFWVEGKLSTQKGIFCRKRRSGAQTEPKVTQAIAQQREQRRRKLEQGMG